MTIRNLSAAIMLGLGTVSVPVIVNQAYAADMETQAIAEQVKARIAQLDRINTQAYHRMLRHYPTIDSIKFETGDYKQTDHGLEATSKATIVRNPAYLQSGEETNIVLTLKDDIVFNDELMSRDILARINGELILTDSLGAFLDLDEKDANKLRDALSYLTITTELRPDGEVSSNMQIRAFDHEEDGDKLHFDGLTLSSQFNESNAIDGVGKINLQFGQFIANFADSDDDSIPGQAQQKILTIYPFNIDYALDEDGNMTVKGSKFRLTGSENNFEISADSLEGEGSDTYFNDELGTITGKQEYVINNIRISDDEMPAPVIIDNIRIISDAEKDGDLFDFEGEFVVDVNGASIKQLTGMEGMEIEDIKFKIEFDDVSANTFQLFSYQLPATLEQADEENINRILQTMFADIAENETGMTYEASFNTDQGDATFVANIKAKSDAVVNPQQWQVAAESPQPTDMINLLRESFDFDIHIIIPESLVQATGMEGMMAMAAGYVVKDGTDYALHLENTDDGIELNGNVIPL